MSELPMTKNLNRRTFLGILGGVIAGAATGFKVDASPVIEEPLEKPVVPDYTTFTEYSPDKKFVLETRVSNELLADSKIDLEKYIRQELSHQMALEMDKLFLYGTGVGEPVGIIGVYE